MCMGLSAHILIFISVFFLKQREGDIGQVYTRNCCQYSNVLRSVMVIWHFYISKSPFVDAFILAHKKKLLPV